MLKRIQIGVLGVVALCLFSGAAEAQNPRLSTEVLTNAGTYRQADDGVYFCASTTTPGTAYDLSGATQNAFSATASAVLTITNGASAGGSNIYLDFLRITFATAGTGGTRAELVVATDTVTRYSSGGTSLTVRNVHSGSSTASVATVFGGAITTAAAGGSVKYMGRTAISAAAPAIGHVYGLSFGGNFTTSGTGAQMAAVGPVVIAPTHVGVVHLWFPSLSAQPTGEVLACWWER